MSQPMSKEEALLLLNKLRTEQTPVHLTCIGPGNLFINIGGYVVTAANDLLGVERSNGLALAFTITDTEFLFLDPREATSAVRSAVMDKYDFGLQFVSGDFRCFIAGQKGRLT